MNERVLNIPPLDKETPFPHEGRDQAHLPIANRNNENGQNESPIPRLHVLRRHWFLIPAAALTRSSGRTFPDLGQCLDVDLSNLNTPFVNFVSSRSTSRVLLRLMCKHVAADASRYPNSREKCDVLRRPLLLVEAFLSSLPVLLLVRRFLGASIMKKILKLA